MKRKFIRFSLVAPAVALAWAMLIAGELGWQAYLFVRPLGNIVTGYRPWSKSEIAVVAALSSPFSAIDRAAERALAWAEGDPRWRLA